MENNQQILQDEAKSIEKKLGLTSVGSYELYHGLATFFNKYKKESDERYSKILDELKMIKLDRTVYQFPEIVSDGPRI